MFSFSPNAMGMNIVSSVQVKLHFKNVLACLLERTNHNGEVTFSPRWKLQEETPLYPWSLDSKHSHFWCSTPSLALNFQLFANLTKCSFHKFIVRLVNETHKIIALLQKFMLLFWGRKQIQVFILLGSNPCSRNIGGGSMKWLVLKEKITMGHTPNRSMNKYQKITLGTPSQ